MLQLEQLGSMQAAPYIQCNQKDMASRSLSHQVGLDLMRCQAFRHSPTQRFVRVPVVYREDALSSSLNQKGRLVSGLSSDRDLHKADLGKQLKAKLLELSKEMPAYDCTRSLSTHKKFYKEALRGQTVFDFDRRKSFPSAVLTRYPEMETVGMWVVGGPAECLRACNLEPSEKNAAALKEFCNAAAGSGEPVLSTFLEAVGLTKAPEWVLQYRQCLRDAAKADVAKNPHWRQVLEEDGYCDWEVTNKVHYMANCVIERCEGDLAYAAAGECIDLVSHESDGHPVLLKGKATADTVLGLLNGIQSNTGYVLKPYRSMPEIIAHLKETNPEVPPRLFELKDPDWEKKALKRVELARRLKAGGKPSLLVAEVLPQILCAPGVLICDRWKSVPQDKKTTSMCSFTRGPTGGGYWEEDPAPVAKVKMESLVVEACCNLMGIKEVHAPDYFLAGPFTSGVVERLQACMGTSLYYILF